MTGRTRLVAGWAMALAAALLLNLSLHGDTGVPAPVDAAPLAAATLKTPAQATLLPLPTPVAPPPASAEPSPTPLTEAQGSELAAAVDRARSAYGIDALVVGVSIDGLHEWSGGSGFAADGVTALGGDDPFVIASITKTFTAVLTLELVEEGLVDLAAPVTDYLPDVPGIEGVTVRELLDHSSGVADLLAPLRPVLNADPSHRFTPDEVAGAVGRPWFPPGSGWGYSNTNYVLLGMLIERVTGHRYARELADRITGPLGMDGTGLLLEPGAPALMPAAWSSAFWTAGSIYSTANDLLRWGDALYGGRVLSQASLALMLDFNDDDYGLGAQRLHLGDLPVAYGHSGLLKGFTTLLVRVPDQRLTLALVSTDTQKFDPAQVLAYAAPGQPSILSLALGDAG